MSPTASPAASPPAVGRPLTPEQRALWAHARLHPRDPAYNGVFAYRLTGDVDAERLRAAAERVVRASAGLNTVVVDGPDGPRAVVPDGPGYRVPLERVPCDGAVRAHLEAVAGAPMPPDRWPLYDLRVWETPGAVHLTAVIAHLVGDAHALWALLDHVALAHTDPDAQAARAHELALVPGAGTDRVDAADRAAATAFFAEQLAGLDGLTNGLPAPRDADGALPGRTDSVRLAPAAGEELHAFARSRGISPFAVLLAAFAITLRGLTGRSRVVVGVPVANRRTALERRLVGLAVTTLPVAVEPGAFATVEELARHVNRTVLRLLRHRDLDLVAHAGEVFGERRPARLELDAVLTYYPRPLDIVLPGAVVERVEHPARHVKYPLTVTVEDGPAGLGLTAEQTHAVADSLPLDCLRTVLERVLAEPGAAPDAIGLLDDRHAAYVDGLLNVRNPVTGAPPSLWHGFVAAAARRGDAVALQDEEGTTTYAELLAQAGACGRALAARVPGPFVGVSLPRSRRLVAVLLGVLASGKAYVPIDPHAPVERVRGMVELFDALPVVAAPDALPGVDLPDRIDPATLAGPTGPTGPAELPGAGPDDLAYVLFTSGSTGRPKGVQLTHANLVRFLAAASEHVVVEPDDTWCLFHSYAFDFAVWEIFGALLSGGRLVVPSWAVTRSPADLRDLLVATGVTVLSQTPSALGQLLSVLRPGDADGLRVRRLIIGGEALRFADLRGWFDLVGRRARVFNIYGPTECSVWVTWHEVIADDVDRETDSVIGWPLRDVSAHVVGPGGRPLPVGAPGELVIGGPAVSRGYFDRPDLTAERFGPGPRDGERVYRTGDIVRLRPDGRLAYLGRRDGQVQVRGHRVELGEIEAALRDVPGVGAAVVVLDPATRLVAYLVETAPTDDEEVRARLRRRLPSYMLPSFLVRLPELPLSVHGKVDRDRLPPPPAVLARPAGPGLTPAQQRVAAVWAEVLGVSGVGPDEAFFDVGGTSLDVVEVHRRLVAEFGAPDLVPTELFEHTTVRALARRLAADDAPATAAPAAAPVPVRRTRRRAS